MYSPALKKIKVRMYDVGILYVRVRVVRDWIGARETEHVRPCC